MSYMYGKYDNIPEWEQCYFSVVSEVCAASLSVAFRSALCPIPYSIDRGITQDGSLTRPILMLISTIYF